MEAMGGCRDSDDETVQYRDAIVTLDERRRNVLKERGGIEAYREGEVSRLEGEIQRKDSWRQLRIQDLRASLRISAS